MAFENRFTKIESDLTVLKWMVGTLVALVLALFWQGFSILSRLPR